MVRWSSLWFRRGSSGPWLLTEARDEVYGLLACFSVSSGPWLLSAARDMVYCPVAPFLVCLGPWLLTVAKYIIYGLVARFVFTVWLFGSLATCGSQGHSLRSTGIIFHFLWRSFFGLF